jgi:hypothetical protein
MIRYEPQYDAWFSGKNRDEQGMPSKNFTGDFEVCLCSDCVTALAQGLGTNLKDLPPI